MPEFRRRQDEYELSLASLVSLRALLSSLPTGTAIQEIDFKELKRRLRYRLPSFPNHVRTDPLVILPEHEGEARELLGAIGLALHKIAGRLDIEWRPGQVGADECDDDYDDWDWSWALGAVTFSVQKYQFLRGEIELRKTEPIAPGIPDGVIEFLVTVPGTKDKITREIHGHFGYHYHYLDSKERRSDTLLTFDRKSTSAATPDLCWERHAEGDKFKAKAGMWGVGKRKSVYSVCHPQASSIGLGNFKRPASDAEIVWPLPVAAATNSGA